VVALPREVPWTGLSSVGLTLSGLLDSTSRPGQEVLQIPATFSAHRATSMDPRQSHHHGHGLRGLAGKGMREHNHP